MAKKLAIVKYYEFLSREN